jgi:hypothetical protein
MNYPSRSPEQLPDQHPDFQTINVEPSDQSPTRQRFFPWKKLFDRIQRIHFFTFLLVIFLGASLYQVIRHSSRPSYATARQWIQPIEKNLQKLFVSDSQKVKNLTHLNPATPKSKKTQTISTNQTKIDNTKTLELEKHLASVQNYIEQLNQRLESIQQHRIETTQQLEIVSQAVNKHTQQLSEMNEQMLLSYRNTDIPVKEKSDLSNPNPQNLSEISSLSDEEEDTPRYTYSVHAVIPGRAWLNREDGKILTVSIGSQLPNIGTVQAIDYEKNLVYFDSGYLIGPAIGDN